MKTFCPLPWNSINIRNNGAIRVCCNANSYTKNKGILRDSSGVEYNAGSADLDQVRNSELIKEIRSTMLAGEWHEECQRCMNEEQSGIPSRREYENRNYPEIEQIAIEKTCVDGTIDTKEIPLQYMDIRYGNFCNLKCRMCGATDSHMWIQDLAQIGIKKYTESDRVVNIIPSTSGKATIDYDYNWFGKNEFFNMQVYENLPNLKKLYVVGGEPLYIKEHYELLEMIVQSGYSRQIYIEYNTNMTNVPNRVLELWRQFKGVLIGTSIDGFGEVIEYQRNPANWDTLYKNLQKVNEFVREAEPIRYHLDLPDEKYSASAWLAYTVTTINILHLPEFIRWKIEDSGLDNFKVSSKPVITHHMCHSPIQYNVRSLPQEMKELVADRYASMIEYSKDKYDEKTHQHVSKILNSVITFMNSKEIPGGWDKFIEHTKQLDSVRSESIVDVVPEYAKYFK